MSIIIKRTAALLLCAVLILLPITGCNNDKNDDIPEFVIVPEIIDPDILGNIVCLDYRNDTIFLASRYTLDKETQTYTTGIYTMSIDDPKANELPGYVPQFPAADAMGGTHISAIYADDDGNIWLSETVYFSRFDLPDDFDGDEWDKLEYLEEIGSHNKLKKLDASGTEILSIDLIPFIGDYRGADDIEIDNEGNIYLFYDNYDNAGIHIFSNTGAESFMLNVSGRNFSFVRLPDGSVAVAGEFDTGNSAASLKKINTISKGFEENIKLPNGTSRVHTGNGSIDLLINDGTALYGFKIDSGDKDEILNWKDSKHVSSDQRYIRMLSDGRILCGDYKIDTKTHLYNIELAILERTPVSEAEPVEITKLTLATFMPPPGLRSAVMEFNKTNTKYQIELIDYNDFSTNENWRAGLIRLSTEIITGNAPDIIDVTYLPLRQYISAGLLEDLYQFIDNDPKLDRSSFMDGALRALEVDGGLYRIYPTFYINTLVGLSSTLGPEMGWDIKEFLEVIAANPEATVPFSNQAYKTYLTVKTVELSLYDYVDWNSGTVHFDSEEFLMLLEFIKTLPDDPPGSEPSRIESGEQIMATIETFSTFFEMQKYQIVFGGDLVFKGFPTENKNGNSIKLHSTLAITSLSSNKEGAWEFIRMLLTDDWLDGKIEYDFEACFPLNKEAFYAKLEVHMAARFTGSGRWEDPNYTYAIRPVTQDEADQILALIDSLSGTAGVDRDLTNIIWEVCEDFYNGKGTARDAVNIIQSRTSIYVSEQKG